MISLLLQIGVKAGHFGGKKKKTQSLPVVITPDPLQAWLFLPVCRVACHPDRGGRQRPHALETWCSDLSFWQIKVLVNIFELPKFRCQTRTEYMHDRITKFANFTVKTALST